MLGAITSAAGAPCCCQPTNRAAGENNVNGFGLEFYIETPVRRPQQCLLLGDVCACQAGVVRAR